MTGTYRWRAVALTINGYEVAGSPKECARIARGVDQQLDHGVPLADIDAEDLRIALFFSERAARHSGNDYGDFSRENEIVDELVKRYGEQWINAQLKRKPGHQQR